MPLAATITDSEDAIQLEAIAAELNLFLVDKIVPRKRVGLIVEVRNSVAAEPFPGLYGSSVSPLSARGRMMRAKYSTSRHPSQAPPERHSPDAGSPHRIPPAS